MSVNVPLLVSSLCLTHPLSCWMSQPLVSIPSRPAPFVSYFTILQERRVRQSYRLSISLPLKPSSISIDLFSWPMVTVFSKVTLVSHLTTSALASLMYQDVATHLTSSWKHSILSIQSNKMISKSLKDWIVPIVSKSRSVMKSKTKWLSFHSQMIGKLVWSLTELHSVSNWDNSWTVLGF